MFSLFILFLIGWEFWLNSLHLVIFVIFASHVAYTAVHYLYVQRHCLGEEELEKRNIRLGQILNREESDVTKSKG